MKVRFPIGVKRIGRKAFVLLPLLFVLLAAASTEARAQAIDCVGDAGGIVDGFVNYPVPPSQINIDGPCTIRNYTAANPLTSNISWFGSLPGSTLLILDNVYMTGNMSCNLAVQGNKIWLVNGSATTLNPNCLSLLIPVEKIDKQILPQTQTTAAIGVPFTYKMVIPVLFDPASGTVINTQGSVNDLHSITVTDDLNAIANASVSFVSYNIYWLDDLSPVPHTFTNVGGFLTWDNIPIVTAGRQFAIELTLVLNDVPANVVGNSFFNTARWDFGRLIAGVFYEPLPGENGISPPLTIAAPVLEMDKTGPATMNLGQTGNFTLDVRNAGLTDAWDVHLRDRLPDGPTGGMCDLAPIIQSAQVFAANGTTPVPGKGPLNPGIDYLLTWSGAPNCRLDLTMMTAAARIGPGERLIVRYTAELDANTQNGVALTNVAGAIQWFNDDNGNASRVEFDRNLTNGTPGFLDHEDAWTVNVVLSGFFFEKTVADLTSGVNPATTASPGDVLRYTLRFRTTDQALPNFRIFDDLDALNNPAAFVPGTLVLVSVPAGADTSNTDANGGSKGTGLVDIRNLSLPANSQLIVQFDITLASTLTNNTIVSDQAVSRRPNNSLIQPSDDPNVNGIADPLVVGDEDPTRIRIISAAAFLVQKISTDLTGDPNVLLAGETLRYTITVQNTGNDDAVNVTLRDTIPVNTTYVPGSTRLNGVPVADVGGTSPLVGGMLINSPSTATPGSMPRGSAPAVITFDVVVDPNVLNGTIISNQGFVSAIANLVVDQPSDDPDTAIPNDPTRDVVGNSPLVYAQKTAVLLVDLRTPGVVDPGDVLRYTITIQNSGGVPATGVVLSDPVPANTTYQANTTTLNGLPVGQPDGGVAPLASGIDISSSDLTPPLPGAGAGVISPGASATLQYDLSVNSGTPAGTLIVNQAIVDTVELPDLPTDADGNPGNGNQPTIVVVGGVQELSITKQVSVVGGGPALPGSQLDYVVTVTNIAAVPAIGVVVTDSLPAGQLTYVNGSATMNGSTTGVSFASPTITGDYGAAYGPLAPGGTVILRFRATLDPTLAQGTTVTNTGTVTWDTPTQTASASVSIVVGGIPGIAALHGSVWHDADFDDVRDASEHRLAGWTVELTQGGPLLFSGVTDVNGDYDIQNVVPNNVVGAPYEIRFRAPGAGPNTALLGRASSVFTNGMQLISGIIVSPGANLQNLNLPIDPNGIVYNSMARVPIGGATLTLTNGSGNPLPTTCFDDPAQQGQVTLPYGYYKFSLNFNDPACPTGGDYLINVAPPAGPAYVAGISAIIPPASDATTAAFSVPVCPGDAIPATAQFCEMQPSEFQPAPSVPPRTPGTVYQLHLMLTGTQMPGTSQIFDNHIPLDPVIVGTIAISKSSPFINVTRGQLVPYVITVSNLAGTGLTDVSIVDTFPAGFSYVKGSAVVDDVPTEPTAAGLQLTWSGLAFAGLQSRTVKLLLTVGGGVSEGEFTNRAQLISSITLAPISGVATATVRIIPDPTFDCTDITGKVFNDANRNGVQDQGEGGLAGVRLATDRGLLATTDEFGRYHITCALVPHESRGSNFVLKLDERSLPSGFRMSTDALQIKRATRGKVLRMNFGASIHRVVAIDLSDAAFEHNATALREQWKPRLDLLLAELRKSPAVLRLSYIADNEDAGLVDRRLNAVKQQVMAAWDATSYALLIEPEIFWRKGAPPKQSKLSRAAAGEGHE
ncbi:MAG TPA: hypothetical protein VFW45_02885 [Candidatus Polarisedimenticolia bacterium]|nr:hypothetical protein [Candidatus Polarisedimenticolia bacterium]